MATPVNVFTSYDAVGAKEDVSKKIENVDPEDTPFYSTCKKVSITNKLHSWQTDTYRGAATNAHVEGSDTNATARTATVMLTNYAQILKEGLSIPDSDESTDKYGRGKEIVYQTMKTTQELKFDLETALFANQAKSAGSGASARYMAGVPTWLATNTTNAGTNGSDPTGDGSDARTDGDDQSALSQSDMETVLQNIWSNSGKRNVTAYMSAFNMTKALTFTGNNNQRATIQASESRNKVVNAIDILITPWGNVEFVMSRYHRAKDVPILADDMWCLGVKRAWTATTLAKTGDATNRQVVGEYTLISKNEKASGLVADTTTS